MGGSSLSSEMPLLRTSNHGFPALCVSKRTFVFGKKNCIGEFKNWVLKQLFKERSTSVPFLLSDFSFRFLRSWHWRLRIRGAWASMRRWVLSATCHLTGVSCPWCLTSLSLFLCLSITEIIICAAVHGSCSDSGEILDVNVLHKL